MNTNKTVHDMFQIPILLRVKENSVSKYVNVLAWKMVSCSVCVFFLVGRGELKQNPMK